MADTKKTGGSIERDLVRRWARRKIRLNRMRVVGTVGFTNGYENALDVLIEWLDQQPARTRPARRPRKEVT